MVLEAAVCSAKGTPRSFDVVPHLERVTQATKQDLL